MNVLPQNIINAVTESLDRQVEDEQAMTKTTAEVKRYKHIECSCNDCMIASETGTFVLATDYATLQQRCLELEAALAAAAVQVPDEVLEAANRLKRLGEYGPKIVYGLSDDGYQKLLSDPGLAADFILQLAGKDGGNG